MDEQFETRLRTHLRSVDDAPVAAAEAVATRAALARRRLQNRRRVAVGAGCVVLVALGVAAVATRDDSPAAPAASAPATHAVSIPTTTPASPPPDPSSTPSVGSTAPVPPTTTGPVPTAGWAPIPPDPRGPSYQPAVVWTGTAAIVLGGSTPTSDTSPGAAQYDPASASWQMLPEPDGAAPFRTAPLAFWSGSEAWFVGGETPDGTPLRFAEAYDPDARTWRSVGDPRMPAMTERSPWAWTGEALLVWPDATSDAATDVGPGPLSYELATFAARALPTPPIEPRQEAASVWTGSEWVIWGGTNGAREFDDGAAYSPATKTWRLLAPSPLGPRRVRAVWTGSEMLVIAGSRGGDVVTGNGAMALDDGAAYDPATDTWRSLASGPAHPGFVPIWTGSQVLMFAKGGVHVYDPAADRWLDGCCEGEMHAPVGTPVWTGSFVLLIGSDSSLTGGETYSPPPPA